MIERMAEEVQRSLGRIEGKLDSVVTTFTTHIKDDSESFTRINQRLQDNSDKFGCQIQGINRRVNMATGVILFVAFLIPISIPLIPSIAKLILSHG